jgi:hypothetical protein
MDWYCAMTEHLLNKENIKIRNESFESVIQRLEKAVVTLYKALLLYQMKSACSYYRNQALDFLRSLANLDDWDGDLKSVTDAEVALKQDSDQYNNQYAKSLLGNLVKSADERQSLLRDIHLALWDYIALRKDMHMDDANTACFRDLFVVDPQYDMENIEKKKDKLLDDAYQWILHTEQYMAFTNWNNESVLPPCRLLWVKGRAGTGKTMLLIGVIRELSGQSAALAPRISHHFFQGTVDARNSATAALRSLVWLLLVQQPHLISYLQEKHKYAGSSLFTGDNAFLALSDAFKKMLKDPQLSPVYLIADALDECDQGLTDLVELIQTSLSLSEKVRWLVSSRPEVELNNSDTAGTLLELDTQNLERPVNAYIKHKLSALESRTGYNHSVLSSVSSEVRQRAENTFLWVALAFKELDSAEGWDAVGIIRKIPPTLSKLYDLMMTRIEDGSELNRQRCKNVLVATFLAYRPLSLDELAVVASLLPMMSRTIVEKCGSFLTVTGETVHLIHQSAKDYLKANFELRLQKDGVLQGHRKIVSRSLDAMSTLQRDIYGLQDLGLPIAEATTPGLDPLASIRYSCVYWVGHLCGIENGHYEVGLCDNGTIHSFLKEHFLHWLEALSLCRSMSDGVASMAKLEALLQVNLNSAFMSNRC